MQQDWKNALFETLSNEEQKELKLKQEAEISAQPKYGKQNFRIELDKRQKGKIATLITGFEGTDEQLKELARQLKTRCGTGGSTRDGEILIQGDCRKKIADILTKEGYKISVK